MKNKFLWTLSAAAMLAAPLGTARADLVLQSFNPIGGTGLGTVTTILTIQNTPTETGCIGFGGTLGAMVDAVGACMGSSADVKPGAAHTGSYTVGELGISSASTFGIILNAAEPAGNPITVDELVASFYGANGSLLYQAMLPSSVTFDNTATGTGNSGFLFQLDATQAAELQATGFFSNTNNVYGLASSISQSAGGQETFFAAEIPSTVPEPGTYALMATGLVGLAGFARRRRQQA